ncbi:alpha,alpha-trehalose-phosphate synthase [Armillaria novae-zelandiae]|uniref:Alpha,alpha-trehalose-phosphate synthase n=1 Tax=Armillaria novae-zelandiae TaxID=153914 RepID=A0AA39NVA4_9AGAR|nr:alpha,alpha-trehalose-phosphate synthase [Armillaria novae-zelandiae]
MSSSSSFRNHRVVIASLFLPNTIVLGTDGSGKSTPDKLAPRTTSKTNGVSSALKPKEINMPEVVLRLQNDKTKPAVLSRPAPLKSIVEDLKDRSRHPTGAPTSPVNESSNPFSKMNTPPSISKSPSTGELLSPAKGPPLSYRTPNQRRLRRRTSSRSLSRRGDQVPYSPDLDGPNPDFHIEPNAHCNGGLKNAVDSVSFSSVRPQMRKKVWVGTLGVETDSWSDTLRQRTSTRLRAGGYESEVVWVEDTVFEGCYDEFCHQVLWPALHYAIPDAPKTTMFYESASFKQYVKVNQKFADTIKQVWREGDVVWVNDYHLMLLPAMLRAAGVTGPIGFFMHVAFPSSEIFRCLSVREKLLKGMLGADLVGFQTANYARHFRQTCSRILAVEALPRGIQLMAEEEGSSQEGKGRFVDVGVYPMGIDVALLRERRREPEVSEWIAVLKQRYAGMKLIVGRDKMDEIQGVKQKIQAFELFLQKHPEYQGKVVLIQIAIPSNAPRSPNAATPNSALTDQILTTVSSINSRFSTLTYQPIVFLPTSDVTYSQYLALLTCADAFIVTSLREGMALRTHEFVVLQEGKERGKEGVLILSEFTGSWSFRGFRSCIGINPWDKTGTANSIYEALNDTCELDMTEGRCRRWEELLGWVEEQSAQKFVTGFLGRCSRAWQEHQRGTDGNSGSVEVLDKSKIGRVLVQWRHCKRRLVLVDLEGTLWDREKFRFKMKFKKGVDVLDPGLKAAIEVLRCLNADKRNEVWVLSGLTVQGALGVVAKELSDIGIVAENGCFIKTRTRRGQPSQWINMVGNLNMTWKSSCVEMLNYFTERTPNSFVEERQTSVVWRFWTGDPTEESADRQWARRQAAEAQNHIFDSLGERYGLRIIPGANSFLVLPNNISRSTAVGAILHPGGPAHAPLSGRSAWTSNDLAMESGDDLEFVFAVSGDEKLLRRLNELDTAETCSTSGKGTDAKWQVDRSQVGELLKLFAGV